ncbi:MAG: Na+/H+ antiporter subunit E [Micrococcus sp.]|nr:Na+/H+ antiporter subunit E [Micrococcus sp.]
MTRASVDDRATGADVARAVVVRGGALALLWVVLAGWSADYAIYGAVSVAAAVALSLASTPPRRRVSSASARGDRRGMARRVVAGAAMTVWFLGQSFKGGVDVARRALSPRVDVSAVVVSAPVTLPPGAGRWLALTVMNLMPGTMVQTVSPDDHASEAHVQLHSLSAELDPAGQWAALERRVAGVLGRPPS